jgi:hypothetical protein
VLLGHGSVEQTSPDLPVTATGKVQKFGLQELLAEAFGTPRG